MSEQEEQELADARRSSSNAAVLTAITVLFGIVWLADSANVPTTLTSIWFVAVIPLNLFLLYSARKRYRLLRESHDGSERR